MNKLIIIPAALGLAVASPALAQVGSGPTTSPSYPTGTNPNDPGADVPGTQGPGRGTGDGGGAGTGPGTGTTGSTATNRRARPENAPPGDTTSSLPSTTTGPGTTNTSPYSPDSGTVGGTRRPGAVGPTGTTRDPYAGTPSGTTTPGGGVSGPS